jgi:hypothetical protein
MDIKSINYKTVLCFEVDEITCENWTVAVKPDGSNTVIILSPYFIKKVYNYAVRHKVLKGKNVK